MAKQKVSRKSAILINRFLDQWLPPAIRDSRLLMMPLLRLAVQGEWRMYARFKEQVAHMTDEQFADVYRRAAATTVHGDSDLNDACVERIHREIRGRTVLDAGCGRGALLASLNDHYEVTGADVVIDPAAQRALPGVKLVAAAVEELPFEDAAFDTVLCTHTLEHVRDLSAAIEQLRRVTKQRLIVVVPRQRCYRYTFNLHIHFFPYAESLLIALRAPEGARCELVDGDFLYIEDRSQTPTQAPRQD